MTNPSDGADPVAADRRGPPAGPLPRARPRPAALDVIPIGPNVFAALASFIILLLAPHACLQMLAAAWDDVIGEDPIASHLVLATPGETLLNAAVGSAMLVVIGAILQTWRFRRPFSSRWPTVLAFPIAWAMLLPEALLGGGSVLSVAVVGTTLALVFAVHWGLLTLLIDVRE